MWVDRDWIGSSVAIEGMQGAVDADIPAACGAQP